MMHKNKLLELIIIIIIIVKPKIPTFVYIALYISWVCTKVSRPEFTIHSIESICRLLSWKREASSSTSSWVSLTTVHTCERCREIPWLW